MCAGVCRCARPKRRSLFPSHTHTHTHTHAPCEFSPRASFHHGDLGALGELTHSNCARLHTTYRRPSVYVCWACVCVCVCVCALCVCACVTHEGEERALGNRYVHS